MGNVRVRQIFTWAPNLGSQIPPDPLGNGAILHGTILEKAPSPYLLLLIALLFQTQTFFWINRLLEVLTPLHTGAKANNSLWILSKMWLFLMFMDYIYWYDQRTQLMKTWQKNLTIQYITIIHSDSVFSDKETIGEDRLSCGGEGEDRFKGGTT